ncbi:hypothetical protein [Cupriavidus consociatus]|uniref:hypothetical protein n=1 Tax=Cupriavidus consociatus TaxID=2821357 RepID=UPI001FD7613D|nr:MULTISPECIES: hypothetical protein [unclassified Cupriavidus]MDK2662035.1 hypothetical protein [Cupriavidus sp. LEh21]
MSSDSIPEHRPAVLKALLDALVDRIEAKPFAQRRRDISFPLNAGTWPAFFAIALHGERMFVWRALEALQTQSGLSLVFDQRRGQRDLDIWERSPKLVIAAHAEAFLRDETGRQNCRIFVWRVETLQTFLIDVRDVHVAGGDGSKPSLQRRNPGVPQSFGARVRSFPNPTTPTGCCRDRKGEVWYLTPLCLARGHTLQRLPPTRSAKHTNRCHWRATARQERH